jgi:nucleoside-diphosphate-sugar epimerase
MKLLVIGGTGSLSTAVVQEALNRNFEIYMINRGNRMEFVPRNVRLLKADIRNEMLITSLLKDLRFDAVIDFICFTPEQMIYSFNLFKTFASQYVFISSCIVYDIFKNSAMCDENSPKVLSAWFTSVNKYLCEEYLVKNAPLNGINYTIIRPATNYGNTALPNGGVRGGNRLVLIDRIIAGKPIIIWNNGENRINVIHVSDFAVGVVGIVGNEKAYNNVFNIVGDETPSRNEILYTLSDLLGKELKTVDIPSKFIAAQMLNRYDREEMMCWDSVTSTFSNQKIKSVVKDFKQNITLNDGLKQTLEYYWHKHYNEVKDYQFEGSYDRVIAKYTRENNISLKGYNLKYHYYNNSKKEKENNYLFQYSVFRYINPKILKYGSFILRMVRRIWRLLKFRKQ